MTNKICAICDKDITDSVYFFSHAKYQWMKETPDHLKKILSKKGYNPNSHFYICRNCSSDYPNSYHSWTRTTALRREQITLLSYNFYKKEFEQIA